MEHQEIEQILKDQNEQMAHLQQIVKNAIDEQQLINDNLLHPATEMLSPGQRISDKVARFGGSWKFIILFTVVLIIWIVYNTLAAKNAFDPYPFILMNLVLSCVAALQAPVIMMSQNRQEEKDRQRGENDYLVNMKAELEIRSLHEKMDLLVQEQIKTLYDIQAKQMGQLEELDKKLRDLCERKG